MLEAKNILLSVDSQLKKYGFFTTRYIEAESAFIAKEVSIELVRSQLEHFILNKSVDEVLLEIESVTELVSFGDNLVPGKGFSWYPEDAD